MRDHQHCFCGQLCANYANETRPPNRLGRRQPYFPQSFKWHRPTRERRNGHILTSQNEFFLDRHLTPQFTKWHRQTKELGNWPILREWKEFSFGSSDVCHKWPTIKQPTQRPSSISAVLLVNLSQPTLKPLDIKTRQRRNWSMKTKLERNSIEPKNINF